ncbi:MAG: SAM-dependent chlorinase/fluorinase [Planctomycetota bacterium]
MITLLTDFGTEDGYVAAMKGVLSSLVPDARVVDISHQIPPQSIRRAGLVWASSSPWFPPGSIHVAVVDPGVGSSRRIVAFEVDQRLFVAPDNGLISFAFSKSQIRSVVAIDIKRHGLSRPSDTFHGRDVFSPVAAQLAGGLPVRELGPRLSKGELVWLGIPKVRTRNTNGRRVHRGEVIDIDHFGNVMSNIRIDPKLRVDVAVAELRLRRIHRSYTGVAVGRPLAIVGSSGYLEVSVRDGNAAGELSLRVGDAVVVTEQSESG